MGIKPYEEFPHEADVGLRVRGGSLAELFENAGEGMIQLMVNPAKVEPEKEVEISASGDDAEMLLVNWLSEILFVFEAKRIAPASVEVESLDEGKVRGRLWGEELDESRHEVRHVMKAVTYYGLKVEKMGDSYEVSIIFDI